MASNAVERRYAAIRTIVDKAQTDGILHTSTTQASLTEAIKALAPLGRTDRWQATLRQWQGFVNESADRDHLRWALYQGAIYAGYAAE